MNRQQFLLFFLVLGLGFIIWPASKDKKNNCTLILNSKYFDHKTNSYVLNKIIIITESIITDIVDMGNLNTADNRCQSIDLKGRYLFPGLIDSHSHLLAIDSQKVSSWKVALELSAARPDMTRLFVGEKNAKSMLFAGFTTVRDLGNSGNYLDEALKLRVSNKITLGPEIITSGPGLAIEPSQINLKNNKFEYTLIDEKSNIDQILQNYKSHNVTWIKLYADNSNKNSFLSQKLLEDVVKKAHSLNFKVAIHAEYDQSIKNAIKAKPDSIEHLYETPDLEIQERENSSFIVLTDYSLNICNNGSIENNCIEKINSLKKRLAWLRKSDFKYVFGSDSVLDFTFKFKSRGEASLSSLISLNQIGLSPLEAMLSATVTPAEMLGLPIGKIEKNYMANLVAYEADPLINLENIKKQSLVMFKGDVICKNTNECAP